jgi:hypothetical protein
MNYFKSRDHEKGPGKWAIIEKETEQFVIRDISKEQAYLIKYILDHEYVNANKIISGIVEHEAYVKTIRDSQPFKTKWDSFLDSYNDVKDIEIAN